ncbi:MAG: thermonuclease family protein [Pseudomonadota bacterium]
MSKTATSILALSLSVLATVVVAQPPKEPYEDSYFGYLDEVDAESIKDGDTPTIEIRMYGIDAPEKTQLCERANGTCYACGRRSERYLSGLLAHEEAVYWFTGQSTYGRPVATIIADGRDVNLTMVRQGHAVVYERFIKDDDMKQTYLDAQTDAKKNKRGIWQGKFIAPSDWRNGKRLSCETN